MKSFRFVDLFAGLGGFHVALAGMGGRCVFASELDETLRGVYEKNFGIRPAGDIRGVRPDKIPRHDVLCAGFPCQPFSKAGEQKGFECTKQGDLFNYVVRILRMKKPRYFILENVPNILRHDGGKTYAHIRERLERLGYNVTESRLSPHQFGIPQIRERAYVVGSLSRLDKFTWPEPVKTEMSIASELDVDPPDARRLTDQTVQCLDAWNRFLKAAPASVEIPYFPLWTMEWGATYPYKEATPHATRANVLARYRGSHGSSLKGLTRLEQIAALPSYARVREKRFPKWKVDFIRMNREFYAANRNWIDLWLPDIIAFPPSLQKLEWNVKGGERDIWQYVIQFRASGVRVKRLTYAPSLIAMTTTQVPIIASQRRYMTPRECARLQTLDCLKTLPSATTTAFKALGNAVNSRVVTKVAIALLGVQQTRKKSATRARLRTGRTIEARL